MSFGDRQLAQRGQFGPAFDIALDAKRLNTQMNTIREWMLRQQEWKTLQEIQEALGYPESSISAQLRHLRKKEFGLYVVEKRRRENKGTWEYRVLPPTRYNEQTEIFPGER